MPKRHQISEEQIHELTEARRQNKNKNVEIRLKTLILHSAGEKRKTIADKTGYSETYVSRLVRKYCTNGISAITENHYPGNRRNMSLAEETAFLAEYRKLAEQGQIIEVSAIKKAYEEKVGHRIGSGQIYYVLHRHGWRKVMPRSKHPKKASDEAIEASKKLTNKCEKRRKVSTIPQEPSG